ERTHPAYRMAGESLNHLAAEHRRLAAKRVLELAVVDADVAARHQQEYAAGDAQRQRLGDPRRLDAVRGGRFVHGGGTRVGDKDRDVGCMDREERADRFKAHWLAGSCLGYRVTAKNIIARRTDFPRAPSNFV